ncbi:MAG: SurA N-terminal domain-containing protein [Muribaculaceae bacterium]|nr:SurA N-terminal domain-containing protein [Muribaculaceae bacterium]
MATLEKIRSKSVLLVVIIAVALLAFILGDAITNGRNLFGNSTTVAKIGNEKIDIQDYQRKQQEISSQIEEEKRRNPNAQQMDSQLLSQVAIEELIDEKLLANAIEALDIKTSPETLRYFMIENPNIVTLPEMTSLMRSLIQSGFNVQTPADAYALIWQPEKFQLTQRQVAPYQQMWMALEAEYGKLISQQIYSVLLANTFKANALDIEAARKNYVATSNITVAKKPYGDLDEKTYPVSEDDLKKAYENRKQSMAVDEETKEVSFIAVKVDPSGKDLEEATVLATTVIAELKAGSVSKETRKNGLDVQRHELPLKDVKDMMLKNFLDTAASGQVATIQSGLNGFRVSKLESKSSQVDEVKLRTIVVQGGDSLVNEVMAYANSDQPLDSINNVFSVEQVALGEETTQPLYSDNGSVQRNLGMTDEVFETFFNSNGKFVEINKPADDVTVLATVVSKSEPVEVVVYETVDYVLHPSDATLADARAKLEKFLAANNTAKKFAENAEASGFQTRDVDITPSTPAMPMGFGSYFPESRGLARWIVMDAKTGEVSKVYQSKDPTNLYLYAAGVLDAYEDYKPLKNKKVREELTAQVRKEKAGKAMVEKYKKENIQASAKAMAVEPVEVASVQVNKFDPVVNDNKVKGRILGTKADGKLHVVAGDDAVYAFVVTEAGEEPVQLTEDDFAQMFMQTYQLTPNNLGKVLRGKKKVKNYMYKFEAAE